MGGTENNEMEHLAFLDLNILLKIKFLREAGVVVVHTSDPCTAEAKAGRSLRWRPAWCTRTLRGS